MLYTYQTPKKPARTKRTPKESAELVAKVVAQLDYPGLTQEQIVKVCRRNRINAYHIRNVGGFNFKR